MMAVNTSLDLMHGRLEQFESLFAQENYVEELDCDFFVNAINSIPLQQRMKIKPELLTDSEIENFEAEANNSLKYFQEKLIIKSQVADFDSGKVMLDPNETESDFNEKRQEGSSRPKEVVSSGGNEKCEENRDEIFLKYFYDPKGNILLVPSLLKNIDFSLHPETVGGSSSQSSTNFAGLEKLLHDISVGKYDQYTRARPTPPSSSSSESEEEVSLRVRNLSANLMFLPVDTNKFYFLKKITDDSLKINNRDTIEKEKTNFQPLNWLTSDGDSESEALERSDAKRKPKRSFKKDNETKHKKLSVPQDGQTSGLKNKNQCRRKPSKDLSSSSKSQACTSRYCPANLLTNSTIVGDNYLPTQSTSGPSEVHPEISSLPTHQGEAAAAQFPIQSPMYEGGICDKETPIKSESPQSQDPKSSGEVKKEASDSSDEDWESLAQKNLSVVDKLLNSNKK